MKRHTPHHVQILLFCGMILWIPFMLLHSFALEMDILNTKELPPFAAQDSGGIVDYLLNVRYWDAFRTVSVLLAVFCFFISFFSNGREHAKPDAVSCSVPGGKHLARGNR